MEPLRCGRSGRSKRSPQLTSKASTHGECEFLLEKFIVTKRRLIGVGLAATCALVASSLWYSPLMFGRQFAELSDRTSSGQPNGTAIAAELMRNVLLASVIKWLLYT